ncbi:MAG: hypothetical protein KDJ70_20215 [Candidatus Competibacteraceae bacterium]|nr:hypothetical protein [Candidatus Competibacteraceae bacterium]
MDVLVVLPRAARAEIASGRKARRALSADRVRFGVESNRIYPALLLAPRRALPEEDASHLRLDPVGVQRRIGHGLDGRDGRGARRVRTAHPGVQG